MFFDYVTQQGLFIVHEVYILAHCWSFVGHDKKYHVKWLSGLIPALVFSLYLKVLVPVFRFVMSVRSGTHFIMVLYLRVYRLLYVLCLGTRSLVPKLRTSSGSGDQCFNTGLSSGS